MTTLKLTALALLAVALGFGQDVAKQSVFFEDIPFSHPVSIPDDVLKILLQTEAGKEGMEFSKNCVAAHRCNSKFSDPASLFRAAEVQLDGPNEVGLIVIGVCPMCGADNGWFWLVRSPYNNPLVVLWAGGNSLELLDSRTHGLRDVRSVWSSPSETVEKSYHFDGSEYKQWKKQSRENQ